MRARQDGNHLNRVLEVQDALLQVRGAAQEAYSQDKQRDKNTYWELWQKVVSHRDFMLEHDFRKLMARSGLAKHDVDMIWKRGTFGHHGRCSFDAFSVMMKLSHLAQSRVPLYIVNVSKLIFYHPPVPLLAMTGTGHAPGPSDYHHAHAHAAHAHGGPHGNGAAHTATAARRPAPRRHNRRRSTCSTTT